MTPIEIALFISVAIVVYPNVIYPLLIWALATFAPAPRSNDVNPGRARISIIMAAHKEPALAARVSELHGLLETSELAGEIVVVLDGCHDGTIVSAENLRVITLIDRCGKATALNAGCAAATGDLLIFADVRQTWDTAALNELIAPFSDRNVGAVSGELKLASASGVTGGIGLYWRHEKWIRKCESRFHSTVGVTGAICAVRARLFKPMPAGLILDDVYWPLRVAMANYRVVFQQSAIAYDQLPQHLGDEFRRKVRTQSGTLQLLQHLPDAMLPWRSPIWWQLISHKLMRLLVPWGMLAIFLTNLALLGKPPFAVFFGLQCLGYGLALVGLSKFGVRLKPASVAGAFLILNCAAFLACWVWILGRAERSWTRASYATVVAAEST